MTDSEVQLNTLARELVDAKREKRRTEAEAEAADKRYRSLEADFWHKLDELKRPTFDGDLGEGYGRVQLQRRENQRARVLNYEELVEALTEEEIADTLLGDKQLRQRVANDLVRTRLKNGQALPRGLDFTQRRWITVTER